MQEAWLGVLQGIQRFEGRSSLRTWILRIVTNIAKTQGTAGSRRSVPFASLGGDDLDAPPFDPDRFLGPGQEWAGHWSTLPGGLAGVFPRTDWWRRRPSTPCVRRAIEALPPMQAEVIRLRDVAGWASEEVRNALDLTETNQRVLLHRARAKVRAASGTRVRDRGFVMTRTSDDDLTCRELVEVITDFVEGAMTAGRPGSVRTPSRRVRSGARP